MYSIPRFLYHSLPAKKVATVHKTWLLIIVRIPDIIIAKINSNKDIKLSLIRFLGDRKNPFWSEVYIVMIRKNKTKTGKMSSGIDCAMKVLTEHGDFIRSVIRFHVRNEVEAEDLFQDFFLFLISKPMPQDIRNERAFLYRVISARIKDAFRKIARYQRSIHRYAQCHKYTVDKRPEHAVIEADEAEKMFELIHSRLPSSEALAITLRYKNNFETSKVAGKMGVKSRSVSRYVSAGLKRIRDVLKEDERGDYGSI
jgi:RNA polymerase sigma factor (sigma-70 family)